MDVRARPSAPVAPASLTLLRPPSCSQGFKGRPSLDLCGDLAVLAAGNHVIALWDGGSDPN